LEPKHKNRIRDAWKHIGPGWGAIREFRDQAGFHADKPKKFFAARFRIQSKSKEFDTAVAEFDKLLKFFFERRSGGAPDFEIALDSLLDDLEKEPGVPYQRTQLKTYLMLAANK